MVDFHPSWSILAKVHSLTVVDVDGSTLSVRQLSASGAELDRFSVSK